MTTETVVDPVPPVDPAVTAAVVDPPIAADPPVDPVVVDPPAEPIEDPKPHGNKGAKPWFLQRISEESERARQAETRAQELEAMLERARANPDPATITRPDDTAIETRARQIAQDTINGEKIRSVVQSGMTKYSDWDDRAATLGAAGAASPDFILDVVSVDPVNAHEILHKLADEPQKAARLAKMDPRTRTIELVKMSMAAQGTTEPPKPTEKPLPPKTVSKAPAPAPAVDPGASQTLDWRTDPNISDAEFSKRWDENAKQRSARR